MTSVQDPSLSCERERERESPSYQGVIEFVLDGELGAIGEGVGRFRMIQRVFLSPYKRCSNRIIGRRVHIGKAGHFRQHGIFEHILNEEYSLDVQ